MQWNYNDWKHLIWDWCACADSCNSEYHNRPPQKCNMANSEGNRCNSVAKWDLPLPTDMAASSDPLVSRWEQTIFRISSRWEILLEKVLLLFAFCSAGQFLFVHWWRGQGRRVFIFLGHVQYIPFVMGWKGKNIRFYDLTPPEKYEMATLFPLYIRNKMFCWKLLKTTLFWMS